MGRKKQIDTSCLAEGSGIRATGRIKKCGQRHCSGMADRSVSGSVTRKLRRKVTIDTPNTPVTDWLRAVR